MFLGTRNMSSVGTQFLNLSGGRQVAYRKLNGNGTPTIVFAPGFMSNMNGKKASTLHKFCSENGLPFVRFDYEGVGESPGNMEKMHLSMWMEDLKIVVDSLTNGPVLLIGSSMGGWMSILVAMQIPQRIQGMILIAPALNFFEKKYVQIYNILSPAQRKVLDRGDILILPSPYGEIFLRKDFMEKSKNQRIDLQNPIPLSMPIRLIHGVLDPDVPYQDSLTLAPLFESSDVDIILRKCGKHQMSEDEDLALLLSTIKLLLASMPNSKL
ncbi:hypothetical protein J437_LFUL010799 [Ladona fulva]|uniref:Palmitoyl-protein thioesterase ABHD10, mitochondrial n=1 Tax=Ladona fulva TaxID=123851 RepID=A0A8K0KVG8_LADFU|nr:hypothetical protein J437_LFUL010799 [Ladona fulva]